MDATTTTTNAHESGACRHSAVVVVDTDADFNTIEQYSSKKKGSINNSNGTALLRLQ